MTFNELIDGLATKFSIEDLSDDAGALSLEIDSMRVR